MVRAEEERVRVHDAPARGQTRLPEKEAASRELESSKVTSLNGSA